MKDLEVSISTQPLPPVFERQGRRCYLDPVRKKLIYITPEETVRQQVLSFLMKRLKVPVKMIREEEPLVHYGIESRGRADLLIDKYDPEKNELHPLCVIECKARHIMIEYKGNAEIVSMGLSPYSRHDSPKKAKTAICVAIDNEKETHHALQLVADDNIQIVGNRIDFYHHGRIAVGNKGSGKVEGLRAFIAGTAPAMIDGKRFYLGSLVDDHLWNLDEPDVMKVIENFISYGLIRDEFRAYVKGRI